MERSRNLSRSNLGSGILGTNDYSKMLGPRIDRSPGPCYSSGGYERVRGGRFSSLSESRMDRSSGLNCSPTRYSRLSSSRFSSRCGTPVPPSRSPSPSSYAGRCSTPLGPRTLESSFSPSLAVTAARTVRRSRHSARERVILPVAPRVLRSEFSGGSIYAREPLFKDFCRGTAERGYNIYNSRHLEEMKSELKQMVEEKYMKISSQDPSVEMDAGSKLCPWNNVLHKDREPASQRLGNLHSLRARQPSPILNRPKITVYHRSTFTHADAI